MAASFAIVLAGCIQTAPTNAPCPCAAPAVCCAALDRCVEAPAECPMAPATAPALRVVSISPQPLPQAGGALTLTLDRAIAEPAVFVGGLPCPIEAVDGAQLVCQAGPETSGEVEHAIRVDGLLDGAPARALDAVRYEVAPLVDVTDAAGIDPHAGLSITVARLFGDGRDLIFARGSLLRPSSEGSQYRQIGPLRWADVSAGGLVDGLASIVSVTPIHLNDDDVRDLVVVWGRGYPQNGLIVRGLDGATDFETPIRVDLPKLSADEDVRALPITLGRATALLGTRTPTDQLDRSLFVAEAGVERLPPPFTLPARWTGAQIYDLALVDADGDARADLITCSDVPWLFTQTAAGFVPAATPLPSAFLYCRSVSVGDLDLDGRLDVVAVGTARGDRPTNVFQGIRILRGAGSGFELVPRLSPTTACGAPVWVGSALPDGVGVATLLDVDLDGDLDIFVPSPSSACPGPPVLYRNQILETGALDFTAESIPTAWINPSSTAIVADDLDQDGDLDVLYTAWSFGARGRILRNTAIESGAAGRTLAVHVTDGGRPVFGAMLAVDLDDAAAPDFAPGPDRLRVAITGHTALAITDGPTTLSLGPAWGAVALRVTWPDGHARVIAVPAGDTAVAVERDAP